MHIYNYNTRTAMCIRQYTRCIGLARNGANEGAAELAVTGDSVTGAGVRFRCTRFAGAFALDVHT